MMETIKKFMTLNDCYKEGRTMTVKGLMVHSTATPGVMAARWFDLWNEPNMSPAKCVHAFMDDKEAYQYLPWNWRGWHAGGSANNTHIGIEWCEPKDLNDKEYFAKVWANGVERYTSLCKMYNLTEKNIISHKEGWSLGVASNHGDPDHWWKLHGKTMDMFRSDVAKLLKWTEPVKEGWLLEGGKWRFYKNGLSVKHEWAQDSKKLWYYLGSDGTMEVSKWIKYKNKWCYVDAKGVMLTGRQNINGKEYFLQADGYLVITDKDGVIING